MPQRNGRRKTREQLSKRRVPKLGYYLIITDTKETEQNYIYGLRDSIPAKLQGKLVIKVSKTKTIKLIDEALSMASLHPQYGEPWIVFDRDEIPDFDKIISAAIEKGINVGWSNPCIEIWFSAYLGAMPTYQTSVSCCSGFANEYNKKTGQQYQKDDAAIYSKLCQTGDEKQAVDIASKKLAQHLRDGKSKPSEMSPATTLHLLIAEIKSKIEEE